jgi:hypothetical protein
VSGVILCWNRWGRGSLVVLGDLRREPVVLLVARRHWWCHALRYRRLGGKTGTLVVVVLWHRRSGLWWAGARCVHTLRRPNVVARLLYCGRASWSSRCSGRSGRGSRDSDNVARPRIAVCLSTDIFSARTTLEGVWWGEAVVRLAVRRSSVCMRCLCILRGLGVRRGLLVLLARHRTPLALEAWVRTATLATEVSRICVSAGSLLLFLFVSVVEIVLRRLLFGRVKWIGHAPFAALLLLSGRHVLNAGHWLRRVSCWLTT